MTVIRKGCTVPWTGRWAFHLRNGLVRWCGIVPKDNMPQDRRSVEMRMQRQQQQWCELKSELDA